MTSFLFFRLRYFQTFFDSRFYFFYIGHQVLIMKSMAIQVEPIGRYITVLALLRRCYAPTPRNRSDEAILTRPFFANYW